MTKFLSNKLAQTTLFSLRIKEGIKEGRLLKEHIDELYAFLMDQKIMGQIVLVLAKIMGFR